MRLEFQVKARASMPVPKKMSGQFRFERLPFMSSAEDHQSRPGAFGQPRYLSIREHS